MPTTQRRVLTGKLTCALRSEQPNFTFSFTIKRRKVKLPRVTVIAAAIDTDGTIFMGADGMSVQGQYGARPGTRSKVFCLGEFIVGSCGTVNIGQSIELLFEFPSLDEGELYHYMVSKFTPALRSLMKDRGGEIKNQAGQDELDARVLIGIRGRLFVVDGGYGVIEPAYPFAAVGCADQEALSAMFTAKKINPNLTAAEIVGYGLAAAEEFDLAIRGPFTILSTPKVERALAAVS